MDMDNVGKSCGDSSPSPSKSVRSSPHLIPTRLFNNQVESIKKESQNFEARNSDVFDGKSSDSQSELGCSEKNKINFTIRKSSLLSRSACFIQGNECSKSGSNIMKTDCSTPEVNNETEKMCSQETTLKTKDTCKADKNKSSQAHATGKSSLKDCGECWAKGKKKCIHSTPKKRRSRHGHGLKRNSEAIEKITQKHEIESNNLDSNIVKEYKSSARGWTVSCLQNSSPQHVVHEKDSSYHLQAAESQPSLHSSELMSSSSSLFSCGSDTPSSWGSENVWPFKFSPSYFASTPPPQFQPQSFNLARPLLMCPPTDPASSSPASQDKKYQCLQNLHVPPKPNYNGFQLIGDSMLLRFSQQIMGESPIIDGNLRFLGYCVSGQRIGELLMRLKNGFYHVGKRVVLMIGTNDLLKQTGVEQMCCELRSIIEHLKRVSEQIVILTLPPVPRLENSTDHWRRLDEFNKYIKKLSVTAPGVGVSDLFPLYVCSEEEAEERETATQYYSDSLFCYGCFICVDTSSSESQDFEETVDSSYIHTIISSNPCISINDVSPIFMDRRIPKCRMDCFEIFFSDSSRKDMIHLNKKGFQIVDQQLRKHMPLP